jgi:hypothetical protein
MKWAVRLLRMKNPILVSNARRVCHSDVGRTLAIREKRCKCIAILQPCPLGNTLILLNTLSFQARDNSRERQVPAFCIPKLSPELLLGALTIALDNCLEYMNMSKVKKETVSNRLTDLPVPKLCFERVPVPCSPSCVDNRPMDVVLEGPVLGTDKDRGPNRNRDR